MTDLVLSPAGLAAYRREQLARARALSAATGRERTIALYRRDPAAFARDILGIALADYQQEVMAAFVEYRRVAVRAPHGAGKTTLSANLVLWAVAVFDDVKVITTASAWRQLVHFTWPEIRKWAHKAQWDRLGLTVRDGKELLTQSLTIGNRQAFAAASDNPATLEGAHASIVFVVFDEAKEIPAPTWDALEGAFSSGDAYALAISTPGETSGRFYEIHSHKPGYDDWWTRHIRLEECMAAGRISPEWVEARKKQWGERSAVYQNRVEGEFADSGEDSVIPLRWVELANERFRASGGKGQGLELWGVDPAYKGEDDTALAKLVGSVVERVDGYPKQDLMQTVGRVAAHVDKQTPVAIDVIGVGAGVYSRLAEQGYNVISVNVSNKTDLKDASGKVGFFNLRAYVWWALREALDPALGTDLALPPDDELTGDLTAPMWRYMSSGAIQIESKDDIRERIGRSPDKGDAVCLAYYALVARGISEADMRRWARNEIVVDELDADLLEAMRQSGVDVTKWKRGLAD